MQSSSCLSGSARMTSPAAPTPSPQASGLQPLPPAIAEALADPIVRALMAADGVDEEALKQSLCELVARLARRSQPIGGPDYPRGAHEPYGDAELC
jgi:hypothetical protein